MNIKRTCLFVPDREKEREDGKLRYRIKWECNTVAFNVGYRVDISKWSNETQRCKNNTTHGAKKVSAAIINREIMKFEQVAEDVFASFESVEKVPTADEFREVFNKLNGKISIQVEKITLFTVFDKFVTDMGRRNQWTESTYEKFRAVKNHLTNFAPKLEFSDLNAKGLTDYVYFLRDTKDMRNSTIDKQLGFLKWFLRWATANGYNTEQAFITYSPKLKKAEKKVIFLEWDELLMLYNYPIPDSTPGLARVRDVFCFCCFSSLRYSDVANLKRSNVFSSYISITTIKTSDSLKIELNDYSKEILDKYKDIIFEKDLALPVISNQKMNNALKDLGKLCGIDKPTTITYYKGNERHDDVYPKYELLGTHTARRTFICNALMLGISPQVVMKWTGHSDYKSMKPYIDIADSAKSEAMNLFNKKSPPPKNGD